MVIIEERRLEEVVGGSTSSVVLEIVCRFRESARIRRSDVIFLIGWV